MSSVLYICLFTIHYSLVTKASTYCCLQLIGNLVEFSGRSFDFVHTDCTFLRAEGDGIVIAPSTCWIAVAWRLVLAEICWELRNTLLTASVTPTKRSCGIFGKLNPLCYSLGTALGSR